MRGTVAWMREVMQPVPHRLDGPDRNAMRSVPHRATVRIATRCGPYRLG